MEPEEWTIGQVINRAQSLTPGAKKALMKMSTVWSQASTMTFHHNGANYLYWDFPELCVKTHVPRRARYRAMYKLTHLGQLVQNYLKDQEDG